MMRIVLHIDRLVLKGFDLQDRDAIAEGLRAELGRLLVTPDAARQLMGQDGVPRLKIDAVRIGEGVEPSAIGVRTAQGIVRGIKS